VVLVMIMVSSSFCDLYLDDDLKFLILILDSRSVVLVMVIVSSSFCDLGLHDDLKFLILILVSSSWS